MEKAVKPSFVVSLVSLGTLLEWAEYVFYGYMAITLSSLFFPDNDPNLSLLKTFGIFASGYLMRPLGAIIFGHIGDRLGRKPALFGSLFLMGSATFAIGCLPLYSTVGLLAPLFLLLLRMLQGFAMGGEYNGASIFLIERSPKNFPCLAGSWVSAAAALGMVVGGVGAFMVSHPLAAPWAWRVPFLLGGVSCFIGLWLRKEIPEPILNKENSLSTLPLLEVFKRCKKSFGVVAAIAAFTGIFVYIGNIYMVVFLKKYAALPTHHATLFTIGGEMIVALMIPLMAYLADQSDPMRQYRIGLLLIALFSPAIFLLASTGHYGLIFIALLLYGILNSVVCGPMMKILYDQFPPSVRYSGISFAWSLSAAIFSGTAPMVAQALTMQYDWMLGPSFYISFAALLTYAACKLLSQTEPSRATTSPSFTLKRLTD
ncbi:MAG: MFS transporter [Candidatus Berkiellales bacterium]